MQIANFDFVGKQSIILFNIYLLLMSFMFIIFVLNKNVVDVLLFFSTTSTESLMENKVIK